MRAAILTILRAAARCRATTCARGRKAETESLRLNLEKHLCVGKARKTVSTEVSKSEAARCRFSCCRSGGGGHHDLPSVGRRADAGRGVDGQADVPDIRQCRVAAVNADTHPHVQIVGPGVVAEHLLDGHRRLDSGRGPIKDRKELVGTRIDFPAAPS